ncbi:MAG TPA: HEAT repeat domain-containing protein [Gemmatimonadales bacterium]|nr:HEAT repeat domain-containing protein [Gemmatimonadales bacterium]
MYAILLAASLAVNLQGTAAAAPALAGASAQLAAAQVELDAARTGAAMRMADVAALRQTLTGLRPVTLRRERTLRGPGEVAPIPGDPGDSLYRAGTAALNRGDYARAAGLFRQVREKYPKSARAGDAYYWEAFALYRQGGTTNLRVARSLLAEQGGKFPGAATRGDGTTLYARIQGELARRGDADAGEWVASQTAALAPPAPPAAPAVAGAMPAPPAPPSPAIAGRGLTIAREGDDDDLPAGCDRDAYETKVAALNALLQMDDDRAVPILRRVLAKRDACSTGLRRKAVFLLAQHQTDSTGATLLDVVRNDPDNGVKAQAVFWMSQVNTPQAVAALQEILKTSTDQELQRKALFALSQQRDPASAQILRDYASRDDVPADLQEQAIFWLSQAHDGKNSEFLRTLYPKLTREEAKEKVLFALAQTNDPANAKWLIERAKDQSEPLELRKRAVFWAGQRGAGIADLVGLYATMPDREMREQLVFVYSQSRDSVATNKLFEIAKSDPDPELRKRALFWLGQSNDPRVVGLLQEIIDK